MGKNSTHWTQEGFRFYRIPKALFSNKKYGDLTSDAKILYGLMLDRTCLSLSNGESWVNKQGEVYIYYSMSDVEKFLNRGREKSRKEFHELINHGLISVSRENRYSGYKIVVNPPETENRTQGNGNMTPDTAGDDLQRTGNDSQQSGSELTENECDKTVSVRDCKTDTNDTYSIDTNIYETEFNYETHVRAMINYLELVDMCPAYIVDAIICRAANILTGMDGTHSDTLTRMKCLNMNFVRNLVCCIDMLGLNVDTATEYMDMRIKKQLGCG